MLRGLKLRGLYTIGEAIATLATRWTPSFPDLGTGRGDRKEVSRFEARTADQRAVHIGNSHQFGCVRRLHRPAIKDPNGIALFLKAMD